MSVSTHTHTHTHTHFFFKSMENCGDLRPPENNCALRKLAREEPDELSVSEVKSLEKIT